jgi:hypothetical protein
MSLNHLGNNNATDTLKLHDLPNAPLNVLECTLLPVVLCLLMMPCSEQLACLGAVSYGLQADAGLSCPAYDLLSSIMT